MRGDSVVCMMSPRHAPAANHILGKNAREKRSCAQASKQASSSRKLWHAPLVPGGLTVRASVSLWLLPFGTLRTLQSSGAWSRRNKRNVFTESSLARGASVHRAKKCLHHYAACCFAPDRCAVSLSVISIGRGECGCGRSALRWIDCCGYTGPLDPQHQQTAVRQESWRETKRLDAYVCDVCSWSTCQHTVEYENSIDLSSSPHAVVVKAGM